MTQTTLKLRIYGRVQGVSYRDWTVKTAQKLGVNGWVRNRADGTVEALVCGAAETVEEFIRLCHKGPFLAKVEKIEESATKDSAQHGFERRPTA